MPKVTAATLTTIKVFRDLDEEQRAQLAGSMHLSRFCLAQLVFAQDDTSKDVHFIVSGHVRATMFSATGKEVSFQDLGPGEMFGELAAIDEGERSTHVVALSDSMIASMSSADFWRAMLTYPDVVAKHTLFRLTGMVRMHCERIFEYGTLGVKNRIHAEFLRLARSASNADRDIKIEDPPTQMEIANRVATHREAVARECKQLELLGVIEWNRKNHVIKDVVMLEKMVRDVRGR